ERTVLIEHPVNHAFHIVGDRPLESAADVHRFQLKVPAGATKELTVVEEREDQQQYSLSTQSDEQIKLFMSLPRTSKQLQDGIKTLQKTEHDQKKAFDDFLANFSTD